MINRRLTSAEAAARLGVKPATLYAYVSRGLLHPERTRKGSTFDPHEVAVLARTARHPGRAGPRAAASRRALPGAGSGDPVFVTEVTLIENGRLYYRGLDAVELSRTTTFEGTAEWLWTGRDEPTGRSNSGRPWSIPPGTVEPLKQALAALPAGADALERFMAATVVASLCDDLRHDLNPDGIPVTGRALLAVLASSLSGSDYLPARGSISTRVWRELTRRPANRAGVAAVEAALILAADHELAPSTLAARVTASFRADPYTVVLTGLGPASGSWQAGSTGAPGEVESLLAEAAAVGPERAIGERLRRSGEIPHGFGMPLYPQGDPRASELLARLDGVGRADRLDLVRRLLSVGRERGFPAPNFDMGLGALSFCAGMTPGSGQALFTLGKVAGWLAHAIEEYTMPTRFRSRADYVGRLPDLSPGE